MDELIGYLAKLRAEIPKYGQRHINCQFNGAGMVEKENDLLVTYGQTRRSVKWIANGADIVCALRAFWLNAQLNAYWNTGLNCL